MQQKISLKWLLLAVGIAVFSALVFFLAPAFVVEGSYNFNMASVFESIGHLVSGEKSRPGLPLRLKIPKIDVDAVIEHVGLTSNGAMDTPEGPADTAWFNLGPRPGEKGSSVIDGHSGWKDNIPAVFDDLYKLHQGDKLYVSDDKGMITIFVIREIRTLDENADASIVFGSSDGKAHLNLITCSGTWNNVKKSSSKRLVVFADKE